MTENKQHIETYSEPQHQYFHRMLSGSKWGDKKAAEQYLQKYWPPLAEYEQKWKQIQEQIFISKEGLPDMIFDSKYEMMAFRGGCLFIEEDFKKLQECFLKIGDKHFIVIENTFGKLKSPAFQMKYPANISWAELINGNFISAMIFTSLHAEFFVFGETTAWGKYAAADYGSPLDIVGFQHEYAPLFREKLKVPEQEWQEIATWLPSQYRAVIKM